MQTIFITRKLATDSIFGQLLTQAGYMVRDNSLVSFEQIEFAEIPPCDWLFFYSKTGVQFFFEQWQNRPLPQRLAALGEGTAQQLATMQRKADFVGTGDAATLVEDFLHIAQGQSVCFVRAMQSAQSVQQLVAGKLATSELIVYHNRADIGTQTAPDAQTLVFTSPLNVEAFHENWGIPPHANIVAIGKTTAQKLSECGITGFRIAPQPSEWSLAQTVLDILQNRNENL